jgi:hypothetical protein
LEPKRVILISILKKVKGKSQQWANIPKELLEEIGIIKV